MNHLILTGFMGTGKTTVGRLMARRYGWEFVDTDLEVEQRTGCSVAELFEREGEATFRALESVVLRDTLAGTPKVIATGGGTLVSPENRQLLSSDDSVFCLTCSADVRGKRLSGGSLRPLAASRPPRAVQTLLAERQSTYSLFPQVDTTYRSPEEIAQSLGRQVALDHVASFTMPDGQSSTVLFEEGVSARAGEIVRGLNESGQTLLITDECVAELDSCAVVRSSLAGAGITTTLHVIAAGEHHKTLSTMEEIYATALRAALDRSAVVVAVGGGVVGDMAGLLAATYLRGLRFVLVPTTLLAQIDAAIGGKVGIDFQGAKNMIGAFKPAQFVLLDPLHLRSLSMAVVADGVVEMIKIGMMCSSPLVSLLTTVGVERIRDAGHVIRAAARVKAEVVQRDPLEHGERMLLNFGHTIGHGLEAASGYALSHGRAVAIGMVAETHLAVSRGWCSTSTQKQLVKLLTAYSLPVASNGIDHDQVLKFVAQDKKRKAGRIRIAIPAEIGVGAVHEVTPEEIGAALRQIEST